MSRRVMFLVAVVMTALASGIPACSPKPIVQPPPLERVIGWGTRRSLTPPYEKRLVVRECAYYDVTTRKFVKRVVLTDCVCCSLLTHGLEEE